MPDRRPLIYGWSSLATKKKARSDDEPAADESIQLLNDHIREQFVHNARIIADNEKPERLLKMIQTCPKLKPPTPTNKELWKIVQKVRREVLGGDSKPDRKPTSRRKA